MSDDEWITVGNRKGAREGIDTRKKEGSVPQTYMGSAQNNSAQYERERRSRYWEEVRARKEEEDLARERQRQIDYQKSIRNTEANYPSLVSRAVVSQSVSKPVMCYRTVRIVDPPVVKRDRVEEKEEKVVPAPMEMRLRSQSRFGMLDERPEYLQVAEEEEDLDEKYGDLETMDPEDGMNEWEQFELNGDLEIVGREFDV
jgi:hypothetical protein